MSKITDVIYYWYHHSAMSAERENWISNAIEKHDWIAFNIARDLYDAEDSPHKLSTKGIPMEYFPDSVYVCFKDGTSKFELLTEETFKLITAADCENG